MANNAEGHLRLPGDFGNQCTWVLFYCAAVLPRIQGALSNFLLASLIGALFM